MMRSFVNRFDALQAMPDKLPDLVITDIGLGREYDGGLNLYSQIRNISSSIPIIFLTSHESEEERIQGMALDVYDYITKTTSIDYFRPPSEYTDSR